MSAMPLDHGATFPVGSRPLMATLGAVGGPILHMLDLAQFLPIGGALWTDALISETRRHLAGCVNAVEAALYEAFSGTVLAAALPTARKEFAWAGVQANPQLVNADMIAQMRLRAAIGLLGRQAGVGADGLLPQGGKDISWLHHDADPQVAAHAGALALAELRWAVLHDEHGTMKADLPAEQFSDIVWTVAALITTAICRTGYADPAACQAIVADVATHLIAEHDEGATPIARASMIARLVRGRPDEGELLGQALAHRRMLLFAALAGERAGITTQAVLGAFIHAPAQRIVSLCHVLGGSASDCRHLLLQIQPVRRDLDDAAIVALTAAFDELVDAEVAVASLRGPVELRAKLALIDPTSGT